MERTDQLLGHLLHDFPAQALAVLQNLKDVACAIRCAGLGPKEFYRVLAMDSTIWFVRPSLPQHMTAEQVLECM